MHNNTIVQEALNIITPILKAFVKRTLKDKYGDEWLAKVSAEVRLNTRDIDDYNPQDGPEALYEKLDLSNLISIPTVMKSDFRSIGFNKKYTDYLNEIKNWRNEIAHPKGLDLPDEDLTRALDTIARVCDKIAPQNSEQIRALMRDILYTNPSDSQLPLKDKVNNARTKREQEAIRFEGRLPAWRNIMQPNADVANDRYKNADFAANLGDVANNNNAANEYADPVDFFHRTYLTHGMIQLLIQAIRRVSTGNGDPVIQLKTSFGGGKTHTMLTLYHLMRQMVSTDQMRGIPDVLREAGVDHLPKVKIAVLVGTDLDPSKSKRPPALPGITVNTLWGEIASQLAIAVNRPELYDIVKEADKKGVAPGREAMKTLFDACGPCMILIDEFVRYANKIYGADKLPAGTFDNLMTFIQELAEAAATSQNSLVVASIPESNIEIGDGPSGKMALQSIEKFFGRIESVWTPVEPTESFEIVRRRLFKSCDDEEARNAVCAEFAKMYYEQKDQFPAEASDPNYKNRLVSCYPIHPEVFDILYQVWSTIEQFQRTRGVLRYMAGVVHYLWEIGDQSPLIMPWAMPFCDAQVSGELIKLLGANNVWQPIISKEIDGTQSIPNQIDKADSRLGQINAARRVTRMIMFSTAPSLRAQKVRGITRNEIHLGVCVPGEKPATYDDALNRLTEKLSYLYNDTQQDTHYWFDTRPTLRKLMQDRMQQIDDAAIIDEAKRLMTKYAKKNTLFDAIHIFPSEQDRVADDQNIHLIILSPDQSHSAKEANHLKAKNAAQFFLEHSGNAPRKNKNMLVFLAPDVHAIDTLINHIKQKLSWESIRADSDKQILNLGKIEINEIGKNIDKIKPIAETSLNEAYNWLLVPEMEATDNMLSWAVDDIRGTGTIIDRVSKRLFENELVIQSWSPRFLNDLLKQLYWKDGRTELEIKTLWQAMTSYIYMKRLARFDVLKNCIEKGIGDYFGYSSGGKNENDKYIGLTLGKNTSIDINGFIVKLDIAQKQLDDAKPQIDSEPQAIDSPIPSNPTGNVGNGNGNESVTHAPFIVAPTAYVKKTEYYASKKFDSSRLSRDLKADFIRQVIEEIVANLEGEVDEPLEITLDIKASNQRGFSQSTMRVISENAKTLGFDTSEFE